MQELASPSLLFIFVRHGVESTLERSAIAREHMGQLLHRLLSAGHLSTAQYYQGYDRPLRPSHFYRPFLSLQDLWTSGKNVGSSAILVNIIFGRDGGGEPSKDKKVSLV